MYVQCASYRDRPSTAVFDVRNNGVMLIDFADQLKVNVFDLGATYKQFLKAIGMEQEVEDVPQLEIEPLLFRDGRGSTGAATFDAVRAISEKC